MLWSAVNWWLKYSIHTITWSAAAVPIHRLQSLHHCSSQPPNRRQPRPETLEGSGNREVSLVSSRMKLFGPSLWSNSITCHELTLWGTRHEQTPLLATKLRVIDSLMMSKLHYLSRRWPLIVSEFISLCFTLPMCLLHSEESEQRQNRRDLGAYVRLVKSGIKSVKFRYSTQSYR